MKNRLPFFCIFCFVTFCLAYLTCTCYFYSNESKFVFVPYLTDLKFNFFIKMIFFYTITVTSHASYSNLIYYLDIRNSKYLVLCVSVFLIFFLSLYFNILFLNYYLNPVIICFSGLVLFCFPFCFKKPDVINPTKFLNNEFSVTLKGNNFQKLPINNPQQGIMIIGGAGSGKTKSMIEPLIYQKIKKGYSGIIYDYDFSRLTCSNYSLSTYAYNCFLKYSPDNMSFYYVNFDDVKYSARINPFNPQIIKDRSLLSSFVDTLYTNLTSKTVSNTNNNFWENNTKLLLESILIFLSKYNADLCTLPHAIKLGLQPFDILKQILCLDQEAKEIASSIIRSEGAHEQTAGILSSFSVAFKPILNENVAWILSGNDIPFNVNCEDFPFIVTFGNSPTKSQVYTPPIATCIAMLVSQMYKHNTTKSFVMIDELPTIVLPQLSKIPATARKYGISTIVALQNRKQLEQSHSKVGSDVIASTFQNHFIGKCDFKQSIEVSNIFGCTEHETKSFTKTLGRHPSKSSTRQKKEKRIIEKNEIMDLKPGEFVGTVSASNKSRFKIQLQSSKYYDASIIKKLHPIAKQYYDCDTRKNIIKINNDINTLIEKVTESKTHLAYLKSEN